MTKNEQNRQYLSFPQFVRITKVISLKTLLLLHFPSDLAGIFRMCWKWIFALIFDMFILINMAPQKNLAAKFREMCAQVPKNGCQIISEVPIEKLRQ